MGGSAALVLGAASAVAPRAATPSRALDLLSYGSPAPVEWWRSTDTCSPMSGVRGAMMFVVHEGDVVRMHVSNASGEVHPMHLHGHHALVLSRDGVAAAGSPWWLTRSTSPTASPKIAFLADNPGVWMDHCHNLPHAVEGLVAHYTVGGTGPTSRSDADPSAVLACLAAYPGVRQVLGGDRAQPPRLEVLEGLQHLRTGIHHERPAPGDRLPDRSAT